MKYIPKQVDDTVNALESHPLKDLAVMFLGSLIILVMFYVLAGVAVDILAPYTPVSVEKSMGKMFADSFCRDELAEESEKLKKLLEKLMPYLSDEDKRLDYSICVSDTEKVNALALPGGKIVVFKGLLDEVESDDEIIAVIAHELGHFHNYDHLRGLGRSLIVLTLSIFLAGYDSEATEVLFESLGSVEMKFSQQREKAADLFALELLYNLSGSGEGIVKFMERMSEKEESGKLAYYFASHPHPENRVKYLKMAISKMKNKP